MTSAFTAPGGSFAATLHTHSTLSDGRLPPEEVCRRYQAAGYDFIALTDHFVGLFGYPVADTTPYRDRRLHHASRRRAAFRRAGQRRYLAYPRRGLPADFARATRRISPRSRGRKAARDRPPGARRGGLRRGGASALVRPDAGGCALARRRACGGNLQPRLRGRCRARRRGPYRRTDAVRGRPVSLIATDDAHFATDDAFGGWVMVKARRTRRRRCSTRSRRGHSMPARARSCGMCGSRPTRSSSRARRWSG